VIYQISVAREAEKILDRSTGPPSAASAENGAAGRLSL